MLHYTPTIPQSGQDKTTYQFKLYVFLLKLRDLIFKRCYILLLFLSWQTSWFTVFNHSLLSLYCFHLQSWNNEHTTIRTSNSNHIPDVIMFSVQLTQWTSGVTVKTVNFTVLSGCTLQYFMININFYMHTEHILLQHSILKNIHIGSIKWSASISKLEEWKVVKIIWAYPKKIMLCMNWQVRFHPHFVLHL